MKSACMLSLAVFALAPLAANSQDVLSSPRDVFKGEIASGAWLRIRGPKGNIEVRETSGRVATVTAKRRNDRRTLEGVTFAVKRDGASVTVCAIYPRTSRCDSDGYDYHSRRNDNELGPVDFTVSLPKGVRLVAATGNGDVDVRDAGAEVEASSGNGEVTVLGADGRVSASSGNGDIQVDRAQGDVEASSGNGDIRVGTSMGPVSASTGNGRIEVRMTRLPARGDMEFSTGNGSIDLTLPADLSADVEANVPVRNFTTDFPMQLPGRWNMGHVEGKIGNGGRRIRMSTGNGRVTLRRIG
ncbi:MAG: DUF4097 family beta strand repeat-containing protein [Gemmatimonadales bacterium]